MAIKMPRDGAIIFSDLIGKLDVLYIHCPKCSRRNTSFSKIRDALRTNPPQSLGLFKATQIWALH
jgi:hypothetical protein